MGLKNARKLSVAQSHINALAKTLPGLLGLTGNQNAENIKDMSNQLSGVAKKVVVDEITAMGSIEEIIANAPSIAYYGRKFGIK